MVGAPATAWALEPEVTSDTAAQFYDVRSPTGETVIPRRRLTTTLGVSAYDLLDHDKVDDRNTSDLSFRARMRYDADFGASTGEADISNYNRLVPGFSRGPIDLMYGYIEGRRFAGGWLNFKLGRQYQTDALGWWSFDGLDMKAVTPFFLAVEGYGGLEVRGGMPLSSSRFERDGVWRGDRTSYDPSLYPAFQPNDVAPAMGVALESAGVNWIHGRLTYRRVYNTGRSNVSEFASGLSTPVSYDGSRISQERIGYAADVVLSDLGSVRGGVTYDLYLAKVGSAYGSLDWYASKKLTMSLDYDFYAPTFDADSIWNFFAGEPMNDVGARAAYDLSQYLQLAGGAHVRVFSAQSDSFNTNSSPNITSNANANYYPSNGLAFDEGFNVSINQHVGENINAIRSSGNFGKDGDRVGGDILVQRLLYGRLLVSGRPSVWQWNDKLRPGRDATSFGMVAGIGYKMTDRTRILFEEELDANRLVGVRNRAMVWLSVAVTK